MLPSWSYSQIFTQMSAGIWWTSPRISYGFAPDASVICTNEGEGPGFSALTPAETAMATLAMSLWDDLITPDMFVTTDFGDCAIKFGMTSSGRDYSHAYRPGNGSVWFNSGYDSGRDNLVSPTVGLHGFESYIHEIGHAFGLRHMGNYNQTHSVGPSSYEDSAVYSLMSYYGPNWPAGEGQVAWADWVASDGVLYCPQTPMLNDIKVIQDIYGAETTTRTDNTVYGFNSTVSGASGAIYDFRLNAHPVLCLFDSGGKDTLDLSGFATASSINLAAGSFSSCDAMTNNISIAYGTDIEDAVGGSAADTLKGNALANDLRGNAGNDALAGQAGDDSLRGGSGNDVLDGGGGTDTAYFAAKWSAIQTGFSAGDGFTVTSKLDGTDTLSNVEYLVDAAGVKKSIATLLPCFSVASQSAATIEGSGIAVSVTFTISLSRISIASQYVDWSLSLGQGTGAASADDFTGALSGTAAIEGGQLSTTITVNLSPDLMFEADERFSVRLSNPSNGLPIIAGSAGAVIVNDDVDVRGIFVEMLPTVRGDGIGNVLTGGEAGDRLLGCGGNDTLAGEGGDDHLSGGAGQDVLTGGDGADVFRFGASVLDRAVPVSAHHCDVITDFEKGADRIVLRGIDADPATPEHEALAWRGGEAFSGNGGEVRFQRFPETGRDGAHTMIFVSLDHDEAPEFAIRLEGLVNLSAGDVVL